MHAPSDRLVTRSISRYQAQLGNETLRSVDRSSGSRRRGIGRQRSRRVRKGFVSNARLWNGGVEQEPATTCTAGSGTAGCRSGEGARHEEKRGLCTGKLSPGGAQALRTSASPHRAEGAWVQAGGAEREGGAPSLQVPERKSGLQRRENLGRWAGGRADEAETEDGADEGAGRRWQRDDGIITRWLATAMKCGCDAAGGKFHWTLRAGQRGRSRGVRHSEAQRAQQAGRQQEGCGRRSSWCEKWEAENELRGDETNRGVQIELEKTNRYSWERRGQH